MFTEYRAAPSSAWQSHRLASIAVGHPPARVRVVWLDAERGGRATTAVRLGQDHGHGVHA